MDATRLINPGFWADSEPLALGDRAVTDWCRDQPALEGHVLFQTSGSSGPPKWIAVSKPALLLSAATVNRHLGVDEDACWGLTLPLHHVGGFGVAARAYEAASRLATFPGKWDPARFTKWLADEAVTHVSLVPTQVHDLVTGHLESPPCLRAVVVGGGRLEDPAGQAARGLGWPVLASYGMTETGSQIATQGLDVLDLPYQPAPLPLLDPWFARVDDDGRLWVSGPALFSGSVVVVEGTSLRWVPRVDEWHPTGDRAVLDGRNLTPLGRLDGIVKILGELVDPEAIERELMALAGGSLIVGDFAVVAIPDERAGHALVLVAHDRVPEAALARTLDLYHQQVPGFRRISRGVRLAHLPVSELGKLRRGELRRTLLE